MMPLLASSPGLSSTLSETRCRREHQVKFFLLLIRDVRLMPTPFFNVSDTPSRTDTKKQKRRLMYLYMAIWPGNYWPGIVVEVGYSDSHAKSSHMALWLDYSKNNVGSY